MSAARVAPIRLSVVLLLFALLLPAADGAPPAPPSGPSHRSLHGLDAAQLAQPSEPSQRSPRAPDSAPPAPPSREHGLADLRDAGNVEARRRGARMLGDAGTMADAPALVDALRDADPVVRALSERSLWEVWGRSGDGEADRLLAIGIEQMSEQRGEAAVETFTKVIDRRQIGRASCRERG